jgi:hypothetical protein
VPGYWDDKAPSASHLRLFEPGQGWRAHDDVRDGEGKTTSFGASRSIELALNTSLNAGNLLFLTGAGSSFCAKTPDGSPAPGMSDLWDAVEADVTPGKLGAILALIPNAADLDKNVEKLLTLCKLYTALFNDAESEAVAQFIKAAEKAIVTRADFITDTTDLTSHRTLVRKIARRGIRKPRAKVFTTNYDLCFETAARGQQFVVIDGFSHSNPQVYDRAHFSYDIVRREGDQDAPNYIENVFHLYKLHGSIDWRRELGVIRRSREDKHGAPVLIYPRDSKYQQAFESPYLDLMGAFQTAIREPDTALIISGFGFNDEHITQPIMAAIEANMSLRITLCDVAFIADASLADGAHVIAENAPVRIESTHFKRFRQLVSASDPRITIVNGRFEDLVHSLPDLVATTERERHAERFHALREMEARGGARP